MTEFVQTMNDWKRMCDQYFDGENWVCNEACPMYAFDVCSKPTAKYPVPLDFGQDLAHKIECVITSWAAEYPEPVYPTWIDVLKLYGVTDETGYNYLESAYNPIPADIAEKLGIEPKEGVLSDE